MRKLKFSFFLRFNNNRRCRRTAILIFSFDFLFHSIVVGFDEEATFTLSARGQFKLVHKEFGYNKMSDSTTTGMTTWRCALNQSYPHFKCKCKAYTRKFGALQRVKIVGEHTHPAKVPQQKGKQKIRSKSKQAQKKKIIVQETIIIKKKWSKILRSAL